MMISTGENAEFALMIGKTPGAFVLMKKLPVGFAGSLLQFAAVFQFWLVSPTQVASAKPIEGTPARTKARVAAELNFFKGLKGVDGFPVRMTFIIVSGL